MPDVDPCGLECVAFKKKKLNIDLQYQIFVRSEICFYYYHGCLLGLIRGYRMVLPEEKLSQSLMDPNMMDKRLQIFN